MRLSGVIYDASQGRVSGEVIIKSVSVKKRRMVGRAGAPSSTFWPKLGSLLIIISLIGLLFIFGPLLKQEINPPAGGPIVHSYFGDLLKTNPLGFSLLIPKINLRAKIIPNVDSSDQSAYEKALEQGIAHAKGSVLPGMKGNVYLFAHSSSANPLFYQLKKLEPGDEVIVYFEGQAHQYQIQEKKILPRRDTSYFKQQSEKEQLILQTCWPPGTDLQQLILLATP